MKLFPMLNDPIPLMKYLLNRKVFCSKMVMESVHVMIEFDGPIFISNMFKILQNVAGEPETVDKQGKMILELELIMIANESRGFVSWIILILFFERCKPVIMIKNATVYSH